MMGHYFAIIASSCATLAQLVEQRIRNAQVAGSIPAGGSRKLGFNFAGIV